VQQVIAAGQVLVGGQAAKASLRLRGDERVTVLAPPAAKPLRAFAEEIALDVVYEDDDLAVINKPAGMMVHAGAGATDAARNRGTLVNALLFRFGQLSAAGGALRPGIVHRLDRNTSGLVLVAKNDFAHRGLAEEFLRREVHTSYLALVHGALAGEAGTIDRSISRDDRRRTRMTTRRGQGRAAVSHWKVAERFEGAYGKFTLVEVAIETGRTHQIRVHLASLGHPVVGDALYGAPRELRPVASGRRRAGALLEGEALPPLSLQRNFLHAARLEFRHPRTAEVMRFARPLPVELEEFAAKLRTAAENVRQGAEQL
jgi:23S rRNA pseudouridine1911/1915/1917 synthase